MQSLIYSKPTPALGEPCGQAQREFAPADFVVNEILGFSADGFGEHVLVHIRKRGANTQWLARRLASFAKARVADVGYCGLKDRHAVTSQWFSVPSAIADPVDWSSFAEPDVEILSVVRHQRKLRTGSHAANQFTLTLRQMSADEKQLDDRLRHIRAHGMPNYFGSQRFGRGGRNVDDAVQWLSGERKRADRKQRSLWLSAVRSYVFNDVLARRIGDGTWNRLLPGERVMLDGSHSVFTAVPDDSESGDRLDDDLNGRCEILDVHPTGPLPGSGESGCTHQAQILEEQVLQGYSSVIDALVAQKVKAARRALRVRVGDLQWSFDDDASTADQSIAPQSTHSNRLLKLDFTLPSGSYATVLLDELLAGL